MALVLNWQSATARADIVRQAVETLARGGTVAFPTEAVYAVAAGASHAEAVNRLGQAGQRPLSLSVRGCAEALNWAPDLSALGQRLARRCWPGPVTLVLEAAKETIAARLDGETGTRLCPDGWLRIRAPAHEAIHDVQAALAEPIVLSEALTGTSADQVLTHFTDTVDLVIDDGPSRYGQPPTEVLVNGRDWSVARAGVVPEALVRRFLATWIVFLCTGNTCRSPLAEALCKKLLSERLGCAPAELDERGFLVLSAGLAAMMGGAAAAEAVEAAQELGADLTGHRSRPLSRALAEQADCLVAMTRDHLLATAYQFPDVQDRCRLLRADGTDVADPLGSDREVYRRCAAEIAEHLGPLVAEWTQPDANASSKGTP